jgi:glutathione-regulated potassium-efflux system protein KefB
MKIGVDYQLRELFESALTFGRETLLQLGTAEDEADEIIEGVRERDKRRFEAQALGDQFAARDLLLSNAEEQAEEAGVVPTPPQAVGEEQKAPAE